jgi:nitrogen fixation-related uncharacterized protein
MLLEGSLNIIYFLVVVSIGFLWRPTENNSRYGLEQLPTDDFDDTVVLQDSPITLRSMKRGEPDDYEETAEEILAWAEENMKGDLTYNK